MHSQTMAEPSQLTQLIESFVDLSRSKAQQAAGLDAIVSLLKNDVVTIGSLVREMEMYLTTTDDMIRGRGILLLGDVLTCLSLKPLDNGTIHSLIAFFTERMGDWRALRGTLVGCLALMRRKSGGTVTGIDAKAVAESYLQNLQVQSLAQHDRKLCFELLECLLENYPEAITSLGDNLLYGICEAIDGEKDPQCLMLTFHIVEVLVQLFPDPCGPVASFAGDLFGILSCYFPIHFTHPKAEEVLVKRDDLSRALMLAFSSTPLFEPFSMPLLLEKLSSSLPSAKVDSLKYLSLCTLKYGADRMAKYAGAIWSVVKDALYASGEEPLLDFTTESLDLLHSQENEMVTEALTLLEKLIIQNKNLFLSVVIDDEDINLIFNTITSYKSHNDIPVQSKQKLYAIGHILYVSAKASVSSCNQVFASFFPRLMEALGLLVENASGASYSNDNDVISGSPNYGSLYLCIELLGACRDLITGPEDLASHCISAKETWCCLLQSFCTSLSKIFCSTWARATNEPARIADMYLGVKGLQILATFPGDCSIIPKSTFDNILITFVSITTVEFNSTLLWKLALKALVQVGSFIQGSNESEKTTSYMDIVVDKIVSLFFSDDFSSTFPLILEAISEVGRSGLKHMLKIVLRLEEVVCAKMGELYVQGNPKSAKITLQLLKCFSDELLPWIQKNEGFEEVLLQFVVKIWNQIENYMASTAGVHERELLDATMKVIKLAVAYCSVESQSIIIDKAYSIHSSYTCLPMNESLSSIPVLVEDLEPTQDVAKFCSRDEWIFSLFASVIIALRPQTRIPNVRTVLHLFMNSLLRGSIIAAQALGSLVNKLDLKPNGAETSVDCTFEQALDIIFSRNMWSSCENGSFGRWDSNGNEVCLASLCFDSANTGSLQIHAVLGLAWIGKGLLMRGHEKIKDITMVFLECLRENGRVGAIPLKQVSLESISEQGVHPLLMKCAANAFQILMSDSELCLNHKFHAIIRPLYKQRFFSTMMPILQSLIIKSDPSFSRSMLFRAFAHVISDTPLVAILHDAKKLIPLLLESLTLLSKDVLDKDIMYGLLLVLSAILTDKKGQEVIENAHVIVNCIVGLITYPHMMLVRETAIQCLVAMSELPHTRIYPMRIQVLQAISKVLDDPKRVVRQEAVRCRQAWSVL